MIDVRIGDILNSQSHAIVNTVNCVGVMGKGIALAYKKRYPDMFEDYKRRCEKGEVSLGRPYPYEVSDGHVVINFPTKDHWRSVSRLDDIIAGLEFLQRNYKEWGLRSIAVPPLGCGNGQLEWEVVGPTLHRELLKLDIPVELYAPAGTPPSQMQLSFLQSSDSQATGAAAKRFIDPAWVTLAEAVSRIESRSIHWPVGRVRFQKIAYFLEALGVPLGLSHERNSYGPYSPALKPITARLLNNGLLAEERKGNMIEMKVGITFDDARNAYGEALENWQPAVDRVADLFARMRTDQAELAASVHLVAAELSTSLGRTPTEVEVRDEVLRWKARRRPPLTLRDVEGAIANLAVLGWLDVQVSPEIHPDYEDEAVPVG